MRLPIIAVSLILGLGCATSDPESVRASLASRESTLVEVQEIEAHDQWFETSVPAKPDAKSVPFEDEAYQIALDIGSSFSIKCFVMQDWQSPPWFLREISSAMIGALEEEKVVSMRVAGIDADAVDGAFYMGVEWDLTVQTWLGAGPGSLHVLYAVKQGVGISCLKHEVGYRESFRGVFRALVENFELSDPPPDPDFFEVSVMSIEGRRVGHVVETVTHDDEGDRKDEIAVHTLIVDAPDSLSASSVYQIEWVDGRDRSLIAAYRDQFENDDQTSDLALRWSSEQNRWVVTGTHRGASVETQLGPGEEPTSQLQLVHATREALAESQPMGQILSTFVWSSDDPTRLTENTLRIDEVLDTERARVTSVIDSTTTELIVDRETGQSESVTFRSPDGRRLELKRVHVEGMQ